MTINQIVKELCKLEGKKKQVNVAQMREIVGHLSDMIYEECSNPKTVSKKICFQLFLNGKKRTRKKKK